MLRLAVTTRFAAIGMIALALVLVLVLTSVAGATSKPIVPRTVQVQILHRSPGFAYAPTRMAQGFHYVGWQKSPSNMEITFDNKAGWEIRFIALGTSGPCRTGMEKSFQLDGNKVYWSHTGAEQQAWRCIIRPDGRQLRLVASSPQPATLFADVGLGRVVASGKQIAA
jgi:hypothetical protein